MAMVAMMALGEAARADIPPPNQKACDGKGSGEACRIGGVAGECVFEKCKRRIMEQDKDGNLHAKYFDAECLACRPNEKKKSSQHDGAAVALAFGLAVCAAGVLALRRRERSAR
jgi:hypothetical protein